MHQQPKRPSVLVPTHVVLARIRVVGCGVCALRLRTSIYSRVFRGLAKLIQSKLWVFVLEYFFRRRSVWDRLPECLRAREGELSSSFESRCLPGPVSYLCHCFRSLQCICAHTIQQCFIFSTLRTIKAVQSVQSQWGKKNFCPLCSDVCVCKSATGVACHTLSDTMCMCVTFCPTTLVVVFT